MAGPPKIPGLIYRTKQRPDGSVRVLGYYYQPSSQGKAERPREINLHTTDWTAAANAVSRLRCEAIATRVAEPLDKALGRAIERKLADRAYRPKTATDAASTARLFAGYLGTISAARVTREHVEDYQRHLHSRLSEASVRHHLATLRGLFSTLIILRVLDASPFEGVRIRRARSTRREKFCSLAERDRLIETCAREDLRFILYCGFHAGLRIGEIVHARADWFHLEGGKGFLTIQSGEDFLVKSQARSVPLTDDFLAFLQEYGMREPYMLRPETVAGRSPIRYDCRLPFRRHVTAQGLPWVTPHIMRHTFGSLHAIAGRSAIKIARWLGITLTVFNEHYAGLRDLDDEINL